MHDTAVLYKRQNRLLPQWKEWLIIGWVSIVLAADLKTSINGHIHWAVSLLTAIMLIPMILRSPLRVGGSVVIGGWLLGVSVLMVGILTRPLYGLIESLKFLVILIGGTICFRIGRNSRAAFKAFLVSVYLNTVLLILGLSIHPFFAHEMAAGRWGTLLNYPGSLWRVGILAYVYSFYLILVGGFSWRNFVLLGSSMTCVILDGSRTGMLLLVIGILYVGTILLMERQYQKIVIVSIIWIVLVSSLYTLSIVLRPSTYIASNVSNYDQNGLQRVVVFIDNVFANSGGLQNADPVRFKMLQDVLQAIELHPLFGNGINATKTVTDTGTIVVHMSYLQVWADLGLLGFVSYLLIVCGWIRSLPAVLRRIKGVSELNQRATYYNSIFLLIYFVFSGFFHPISTEWSEWISFLVSYAFFEEALENRVEAI